MGRKKKQQTEESQLDLIDVQSKNRQDILRVARRYPRVEVRIDVPGIPRPKGSFRTFPSRTTGRMVSEQDAESKAWQRSVAVAAKAAWGPREPSQAAFNTEVTFVFPRPKCHHKPNGDVKASAPGFHTITPDIDKLLRCVFDALEGVVYENDCQVVGVVWTQKRYGVKPGAEIFMEEVDDH